MRSDPNRKEKNMKLTFKKEKDTCDCRVYRFDRNVAWIQSIHNDQIDCLMAASADDMPESFSIDELEQIIDKMKKLKKEWDKE